MKKLVYIINLTILFSVIISCNQNSNNQEKPGPSLFSQPKTNPINLEEGYNINSVTGDSIKPIINSLGDTVLTGVKIPTNGKIINPDSVDKPKPIKAGKGKEINANTNIYKISKNITRRKINKDLLATILLKEVSKNDTTHFILNSAGKKVKTGVPIPVKGKKVKCIQPIATNSLPMRVKDNAIANIQYLDVDQGLNSSLLFSAIEDRSGNLWFATHGGGVSRYDGKTFRHYTEKEGLSNNVVWSILEDKRGNLWFGTEYGGVSKYDGETFTHYTEKEGLGSKTIRSILEDNKGNIWFGTNEGGVTKLVIGPNSETSGEYFIHYTTKEGLSDNTILTMIEDSHGNLWFGTNGGGVSMFDGKSFNHYTVQEGLSSNYILSILEDKSGNIWIGTNGGGLTMYDGEFFSHYSKNDGLISNFILSILEDKEGHLWFGSWGDGVCKYYGDSFFHLTEKEGLSNNNIMSMLEDNSGSLWFVTNGGGVCRYNDESFIHYTENEGLSGNNVRAVLEDKNGDFWFSNEGGEVSRYNKESFTHFTYKEGLSRNTVTSILEDKNGYLWFGIIREGVCKYDGKFFHHYTIQEGLSSNYITSILEDKNGNLWFGTERGGVCKYDGKSFLHFTEKEGLSNNHVLSIYEDKKGSLWFGTAGGGVSKYDGTSFIHFTEKEGLSNNFVSSILEDKGGNFWFGTRGGGLNRYDGKSFSYFTEKEGLSSNFIWSLLQDKNGSLWLSTEKGIINIDINAQEKRKNNSGINSETINNYSFTILNKQDGLKGLDFNKNSALIDSKNRAWWGGGKGLEMLDLNEFTISQKIPQPILKQIDINEHFIDYRNLPDSLKAEIIFSSVQRFENYPLNLELPYYNNHLTFHFSAIDWAAPHKIKYQYKVEGLNENWSEVTNESKADFRNLSYGTYTFKVRAIGEFQVWSKPFEYTFTIHPPWWHTTWFRSLYVSGIFLSIYLLFRWRTNTLRKQKIVLEKTVLERTLELKHEKEIVEEKHKEITDSINYAERLQRSLMASKNLLDKNLNDYFIYFNPKESVSGDFYWASELENGNFLLACADSTGHGVPGAIMSMMNMNSLKESVKDGWVAPYEILNNTRKIIIETLANDGSVEGGKDGMDCSLLSFDFKKSKLSFALSNNPLWLIRKGELIEHKADKMPVGKHDRDSISFTHHEIKLQKGDLLLIYTDGYADQFGGPKGKKFKYSNLQKLILENANSEPETLNSKLKIEFDVWKGDLEQVDDVCIIGIKI